MRIPHDTHILIPNGAVTTQAGVQTPVNDVTGRHPIIYKQIVLMRP